MEDLPPNKPSFFLPIAQLVLIVAAIIVVLGVVLGWSTRLQFSDAFFWAAMIAAGVGVGSTFAFAGSAIRTTYTRPADSDMTIIESLRENYRQTRSMRRLTAQTFVLAVVCFVISMVIGW